MILHDTSQSITEDTASYKTTLDNKQSENGEKQVHILNKIRMLGTKDWHMKGLQNRGILGVDDYSYIIFLICKQNKAQICHGCIAVLLKELIS